MIIEPRPATDAALTALLAEQRAELDERYDGADDPVYPVDPAAHFLVAVVDGAAVGCAAIQPLAAGYRPIPACGEYVHNRFSVCFEKQLARASG
jgi:hypothetical protein